MAAGDVDAAGLEAALDALLGTVVGGRFQIIDRIARGGMASVYYAMQLPLNRAVAVKVLSVEHSGNAESDEGFRRRFLQEASILAKLQHPNIVTLLDYGQISDLPGEHYFMAMEYLSGETLAQRFRARGRLSIEESIRLARQIGRGLREAHRRGFIHRDLKPSNIILVPEDDKNDIVKLVDFGIGKILAERSDQLAHTEDLTRVGLLLGSPRHMAPEQIRCEPVELRTDLYGLGVILFQALTGRLPFDGRTEVDVLMAHCSLPPPALSEVCPGVFFPESLAQLVRALLHKHPSGRPTVEEFLERLAGVEEEVFGTISLAGPTLQGIASRPLLPSVTPPLGDWERHTGVTQREWKASVPTLGSGAPVSSVPPHSYPVPGRKKGAIAISVGVVALLALFAFTAFQLGRTRGGDAARAAAPIVATAPLAQPVPAAAQPAAASSFTLTIDSIPSGASVSEGGIALGETPVTITLERSSLAAGPRKFVLRQDGFAAYTLEQFDSQAAVNARIVLVPAGGKTVRPRAARSLPASGGIGSLTPLEAPSPKRNENVLLDIRTRR